MKRSRIILGMAAIGFAAFGAFAFTSKSMATAPWYFNDSNVCTEIENEIVPCDPHPSGGCLGEEGDHAGKQLYDANCNNPLRSETGF